jgi:hypothetical protein
MNAEKTTLVESIKPTKELAPPLTLEQRQQRMEEDLRAIARVQILAGAPSSPPPPRQSIAAKAVNKSATATRIGMAVLGIAVVAGEWIAQNYPRVIGPLGALFRVGWYFFGDGAPPPDTLTPGD